MDQEGAIKDGKIRGEIFFKVECNHTKVEPFGWVLVVAFKINNSVLRICNSNSFFSSGKKKIILPFNHRKVFDSSLELPAV